MAFEGLEEDVTPEELEAAEAQSTQLVSLGNDPEFQKLEEADDVGKAIQDTIGNTVEASTALEALSDALNASIKAGGLDKHGMMFANLAVESVRTLHGVENDRLAISVESYRQDPLAALKTAMEDIQIQSQGLWSSIKEKLSTMAASLVAKLRSFKANVIKLEKRVNEVEALISHIGSSDKPSFGALKPHDWFIDLCYHGKAAPKGLVGIGPAVDKLLKETADVLVSSVGKYNGWIKSNHSKALQDTTVFNSLKYKTSDFLILNQKQFTDERRVGWFKAIEGFSHYRSEELPGGMALFAHLARTDCSGVSAVPALDSIFYTLAQYDPVSYNLMKGALYTIGGLTLGSFVGIVVGLGFAAPAIYSAVSATSSAAMLASATTAGVIASTGAKVGQGVGGYMGFKKGYEKDANGKLYGNKIKLTKDMLFETLTVAEMKRVISEVKKGIQALKAWETTIFKEIYKDKEASGIIDDFMYDAEPGTNNRTSVRLLKELCFAVFGLTNALSYKSGSYALRTYNSMLNYVQKSSYQYK